jgi:hypothetical protein
VPAAVDERQIGTDLVAGDAASIDAFLLDKGFTGIRYAAEVASGEIDVIIPPTRNQRSAMPKPLQRMIARLRNRVEAAFKEITDQMELARHGAHTFEGLLTRTVATLAACPPPPRPRQPLPPPPTRLPIWARSGPGEANLPESTPAAR